MTDDDASSVHSFSVRFACVAARMSDEDLAVVVKAFRDPTPRLKEILLSDLRDQAIRDLAALCSGTPSGVAKELAADFTRYLSGSWVRDQRRGGPGANPADRRRMMYRIAVENRGTSLSWRQILNIIEGHRGR